jgi:hypothetical protein
MLAAAANVVVIVIVVAAITVTVAIVPIAVITLVIALCHPLILVSSRRLVVTCCFTSVAGIFAVHPSLGWLLCSLCIAAVVWQTTTPRIAKVVHQKTTMLFTEVMLPKTTPCIAVARSRQQHHLMPWWHDIAVPARRNTTRPIAKVAWQTMTLQTPW